MLESINFLNYFKARFDENLNTLQGAFEFFWDLKFELKAYLL